MTGTSLLTSLICSGVVYASDIDIYQQARSGKITLMLMLDISGSMKGQTACDLPTGANYISSGTEAVTSTVPYTRSYCEATGTNKVYLYRSYSKGTGRNKVNYYEECTNKPTNYQDCTGSYLGKTMIGSPPATTGSDGPYNGYTYSYSSDVVRYYDRITRVKDGVFDLLKGNTAKGITALSDDKVIGLSTLGVVYNNQYYNMGRVLVPARPLGDVVNGSTQRALLLSAVSALPAQTYTPTARSYAETASYLMGTVTNAAKLQAYFQNIYGSYAVCDNWDANGVCIGNWDGWYSSALPSGYTKGSSGSLGGYGGYYYYGPHPYSGFPLSVSESKKIDLSSYQTPDSLTQTDNIKQCSGQGIYVLTDGEPNKNSGSQNLMQSALSNKGSSFSCANTDDGWDCIHKFALKLLDATANPLGLKIRTAVVGFGSEFNDSPSYNKTLTQAQNIANLGTIDTNAKKAAYWGIIGEGGWYSGSSSQDIVKSVNDFIDNLSTDIPAVTTGTPTIPQDELNPTAIQNYAYYPQFQPTPDKNYQLWAGNLKKYNVNSNGRLSDKNNTLIVDSQGKLLANYDLWSPDIQSTVKDADETTYGSQKFAWMGGVKSQLALRTSATNTDTANRKLLTNRSISGTGTTLTISESSATTLKQINLSYLTEDSYKEDPQRGYLMNLLGYAVDATKPQTINATLLSTASELRQVGAVMHSSPILITNKGEITYSNNTLGSKNREDYIVFGTTQGLLHVVDASTGKEKFAFVPNEMVDNQYKAFAKFDSTNGGMQNLFYGVDGPWSAYTEYVADSSGNLTVGTGKNSLKGKQYVYGGLRMGGNSYYALDLADINNPKLKFHIDPLNQKVYFNGNSKTFDALQYMGQSWSKPTIAWVKWGGVRKLVMFVGGGYDAGYESDSYSQTNKTGAGVYMFDAENGDLLWWASDNATASSAATTTSGLVATKNSNLKYSVVSEIKAIDRDADGLVDHLYFGDLGGQVFRIDLNNNSNTIGGFAKRVVRLLNLNNGQYSPRFYEEPAFSIYDYERTPFAVITLGSGNRSKPLAEYTVGSLYDYDAIYNIYDKDVARRDLYTDIALSTEAKNTTAANPLAEVTDTNRFSNKILVAPYSSNGWFYRFKSNKQQSEKIMSIPLVINNDLFVSTFDASKSGLAGDCGAGVKGESFVNLFCMPYGQCASGTATTSRLSLGAGITSASIGAADTAGSTRLIVANVDTTNIQGNLIKDKRYGTKLSLIPQRWYEKN
ncbi:PilC/PilY family type IV pilus protein [Acinetobacter seifertii]|uniref:PilC/PilY family type IV pilus protein n=1 Tax=Acinetobacter seifertii TaxID=1530123 RepID=UPI00280C8827|nr:PilC/PilY family type IV pilus protein [Acinetobacter seifertii]MDQ9035274.1 PilC/PilY family type IV pilus protein [Acinetobacter seifertii]